MNILAAIIALGLMSCRDIRSKTVSPAAAAGLIVTGIILLQTTVGDMDGCGAVGEGLAFSWKAAINLALRLAPGASLLLFSRETKELGSGDGAVILGMGLLLGFWKTIFAVAAGLALGSVYGCVRNPNKRKTFPFLPFLFLGTVAVMFV